MTRRRSLVCAVALCATLTGVIAVTAGVRAASVAAAEPGDATAAASTSGVLISRHLSQAFGLTAGSTVRLSTESSGAHPREFVVRGVYEPTPDPMELNDAKFTARLHLPDLLAMTAKPTDPMGLEMADAVNVALTTPADAAAFSRDLMARVPGVFARPIRQAMTRASVFVVLERFHLAIAVVTMFASTVFLLALSVMLVDERRETVGVLRLIGLTARRVLAQVCIEGLAIAVSGALFGIVLALGSEQVINRYFQWHYDTALIFVRVTPTVAFRCLLVAVPLGVGASVTASWTMLRRQVMSLARR